MKESPIAFLYRLETFGIKLGLRNISLLAGYLGNPERSYPTIHIAGTNGKGSTASMIASVLTASGYRTGLYTSPHLTDFRERIRVDGRKIPEELLAFYVEALRPAISRIKATFFEATTAIAFQYFSDEKVDIAVIETGLGGRFDATNIITPCLSIITSIGIDHIAQLGTTTRSIAKEKAGIIKPGIPVITGPMDDIAFHVMQKAAAERRSILQRRDDQSIVRILGRSLTHVELDILSGEMQLKGLKVGLAGDFQIPNIQLALASIPWLRKAGMGIPESSLRDGLLNVRRNTGLRGRFEVVSSTPLVISDVAHNGDAMRCLMRSMRMLVPGRFITLFGLMKDKEYRSVVESLSDRSRLAIIVRPETPRSIDPALLLSEFHRRGKRAIVAGGVEAGMRQAERLRRGDEPLVVTGSHYVVGEMYRFLQ
jgi:dihydrofolate synthase / folylpolyglutamate synthase